MSTIKKLALSLPLALLAFFALSSSPALAGMNQSKCSTSYLVKDSNGFSINAYVKSCIVERFNGHSWIVEARATFTGYNANVGPSYCTYYTNGNDCNLIIDLKNDSTNTWWGTVGYTASYLPYLNSSGLLYGPYFGAAYGKTYHTKTFISGYTKGGYRFTGTYNSPSLTAW